MAKADLLERYKAKRDFTKTAEPAGDVAATTGPSTGSGQASFMVQKHDATRLHWDLRLEVDGVLKSWAVTRGPSLDPADKRLSVRTEDHPLSYATFEGTIPAGEYGGGTVMLWDRGTWAPIAGKSAKDLEKGHLHFTLDGERMKGEWLLIRLKPRGKERGENWLLRKLEDEHAGSGDELVERALTSVKTGRTMQEIAAGSPETSLKGKRGKAFDAVMAKADKSSPVGGGAQKGRRGQSASAPLRRPSAATSPRGGGLPKFKPPQLATLVDHVPAGSGWIHEVKYDGYRCLLAVGGGKAKVFTRSGLDWSHKFPEIAAAGAKLDCDSALIDGEIVALDDEGKPSFSALKDAISAGGRGLVLFAFDLLSLDGEELTALPNVQRKERLRPLIPGGIVQFAEHVVGSGEELFEAMCGGGYEGIVSKKADAPYRGARSQAWLKVKCTRRQEFVIVGWSASDKGRGFRSLLLALNEEAPSTSSGLRYAGKVGTGFDMKTIEDLSARLAKLAVDKPAVTVPREAARRAHWVKPKLLAEVAFAEFTAENVVRHASFIGLRGDKPVKAVVREEPVAAPAPAASSVKISSRDRVIDPDSGTTKGQLADHYAAVASIMLPWVANRPISLVRCPQGRARKCFFQKHDAGSFGEEVHQVDIREKDGTTEPYLYVEDADGLLACVQMGTIEFHGWGSLVGDVEKPDRLVFDLDPDEDLGFDDVRRAALDLKRHLSDVGLTTFALLSGGKGVHVIAPLTPEAEWPVVKDFAQRFSIALATAEPDRFVATMSKAKRKGRIFIDWLRNQRGSTAIMPYAARARPGTPVAAPIAWSEIEDIEDPGKWRVGDAEALIERAASRALAGWGTARQTLPDI